MIPPIKIEQIPFKRKSILKTEYQKGNIPLEKDFFGSPLTPKNVTIDHIKPKSKGGKSKLSNYILLTVENNNKKASRDIFEFAKEEDTEAYLNAIENANIDKNTCETYLKNVTRTLRTLWEQSPLTKDKEMWKILKRY